MPSTEDEERAGAEHGKRNKGRHGAADGEGEAGAPCSFPLLLSILARPLAETRAGGGRPFRRAAIFAAALSLGACSFLVLAGSLLIVLGLVQLGVLAISFRHFEPALHGYLRRQAEVRRRRPLLGFTLFGFGYLLAGFG